jgi:hypothetical protein
MKQNKKHVPLLQHWFLSKEQYFNFRLYLTMTTNTIMGSTDETEKMDFEKLGVSNEEGQHQSEWQVFNKNFLE